ncbi:hypothetical protein CYMTET_28826 [Cymbomonas tetramitiformis]|uniref:tRNA-guanine(15) transglycosylase-like domain-containing protein n=1 Tax=Cymbomonas tetramitiformis TaxID=36881 RepID=A0AAE0FMG7_9CHLO|nr:hypothetical protein CYMTET_28826 [Cymbomonas tetramitiformis]
MPLLNLLQHRLQWGSQLGSPGEEMCSGSLGKSREELVNLMKFVMPQLPKAKPNHLLGIADIPSIEQCVPLGVDTFDSCFPTRLRPLRMPSCLRVTRLSLEARIRAGAHSCSRTHALDGQPGARRIAPLDGPSSFALQGSLPHSHPKFACGVPHVWELPSVSGAGSPLSPELCEPSLHHQDYAQDLPSAP